MKHVWILALSCCISLSAMALTPGVASPRNANFDEEVYGRIQKDDFEGLDTYMEQLRVEQARAPSGTWLISAAYQTLENLFSGISTREQLSAAMKRIDAVGKAHPRSTHVPLMRSMLLEAYAFSQDETTPVGKREYTLSMREARKIMDAARATASANPQWYSSRINLATYTHEGQPVVDALLLESRTRNPLFMQAWFAALFHRLPDQGGSLESMAALVNESLKFSTKEEGISNYARMLWFADQIGAGKLLYHKDISWETTQRSIDDVLQVWSNNRNAQKFFMWSCQQGDKAAMKRYVKFTNAEPLAMFGKSDQKIFTLCRDIALGGSNDFWLRNPDRGEDVYIGK